MFYSRTVFLLPIFLHSSCMSCIKRENSWSCCPTVALNKDFILLQAPPAPRCCSLQYNQYLFSPLLKVTGNNRGQFENFCFLFLRSLFAFIASQSLAVALPEEAAKSSAAEWMTCSQAIAEVWWEGAAKATGPPGLA